MADNDTRSIDEILSNMRMDRLALAKAQQPILSEIVDILKSSEIAGALDTLRTAGEKLSASSTVNVQISNLCAIYANLSAAVAREAVAVSASVAGETPPPA